MSRSILAACHSGGHAFTIEDHLALLRWAALAAPGGYRAVVNTGYWGCDEIIEVFIDPIPMPVFTIRQTPSGVVLVDRLGMTLVFPALTDVLLTMVPLGASAKREVLRAPKPPWLPVISGSATNGLDNLWTRACRAVCRFRPRREPPGRVEPGIPNRAG